MLSTSRRKGRGPDKRMPPTCGSARLKMVDQPPHAADLWRWALNSSYSYSAERYSYSYSKSQLKRIASMLTRWIQRTARNADHSIDYE